MLCRCLNRATGCPEAVKSAWRTQKLPQCACGSWHTGLHVMLEQGMDQMDPDVPAAFCSFCFATLPAYSDTS